MESITNLGMGYLAAGIGAGLVTMGAGMGIGKLAASACDGIARQPEAANEIRVAMLITAAMIEVVGLVGALSCLIMVLRTG